VVIRANVPESDEMDRRSQMTNHICGALADEVMNALDWIVDVALRSWRIALMEEKSTSLSVLQKTRVRKIRLKNT
jgi:hypothetical protein